MNSKLPARLRLFVLLALGVSSWTGAQPSARDDGRTIVSIDHYVHQVSQVPSIEGQHTQLYMRERVRAAALSRAVNLEGRVALFVHGAGTPAEVAFDVPYEDYSWMAYLAEAGFDVFSVDMTGYGHSTRPHVMNDPCNLSEDDQRALGIGVALGPCEPSHTEPATTLASDWADIDRAVEHIRALRGVERVSLVGWSLGGPRAGGYAARNPAKVDKIVLLAPAYLREAPAAGPGAATAAMTSQSHESFTANWDRQVGCANQYEPAVADAVWAQMLASDPVGATWGPGIRRAPRTALPADGGWDVEAQAAPTLVVAGVHDAQIVPERVRDLYEDLGAAHKVLIDLGCASHNAMWESNRLLLFEASLEWLRDGTVDGMSEGVVRMGY